MASLRASLSRALEVVEDGSSVMIKLPQEAHFFTRRKLLSALERVPQDARVILDGHATRFVDHDVAQVIR